MKNFLRALRYVGPYQRRLIISIVCAVVAGTLWAANFLAIYPVVEILAADQSPQDWVNKRIEKSREDVKRFEKDAEEQAERWKQ